MTRRRQYRITMEYQEPEEFGAKTWFDVLAKCLAESNQEPDETSPAEPAETD